MCSAGRWKPFCRGAGAGVGEDLPGAGWGAGRRRVRPARGVGGGASLRSGKGAGGGRLLPAEATPGEPAAALFPLCPPPGGRCRPNAAKLGKEQSGPGQGRLWPERPPEHPRPRQPRGLSAPPARWPLPALGPPAACQPRQPLGFPFWNFSLGPSVRFPGGSALSRLSSPRKSRSVV